MKKDNKITFRIDDKDYELIKKKADEMEMNISEFSRFCVKSVIKDNYVPKTKLMYFIHQIMTDSECQNNKKMIQKVQELMEKCL